MPTELLDNSASLKPVNGQWFSLSVTASRWPEIVLVALIYYLTAKIGQTLAIPPGNVTPVWIPSGIMLALALNRGCYIWLAVFLGAFAGNVGQYFDATSMLSVSRSLLAGFANGAGDAISAVGGAYFIVRTTGTRTPFNKTSHVVWFLVFGVLLGPACSALFGVSFLCLMNFLVWDAYFYTLTTWLTGDAMGALMIAPLLIVGLAGENKYAGKKQVEALAFFVAAILLLAALVGISWAGFTTLLSPLLLIVPLLLWSAFRLGQITTFLSIFIFSGASIIITALGKGPFYGDNLNLALMELQWFLAVSTITIYILSAAVKDSQAHEQFLEKFNQFLEKKVMDRTHELNRELMAVKQAQIETQRLESQLRLSHKMEALGTMAGGIAHDFNNMLGIVLGHAELAKEKLADDQSIERHLAHIIEASNRSKELIKHILTFSRSASANEESVEMDVAEIFGETLAFLNSIVPSNVTFQYSINKDCGLIRGYKSQLSQVIINLCTNAIHAMEKEGGTLDVQLHACKLEDADLLAYEEVKAGRFVELSVRDSGQGIAEELLPRIFDPYFTTKETGKGTGMGLSIVHGIVSSHGGLIKVDSSQGMGTTFHVYLPLLEHDAIREENKDAVIIPTGTERILFVDDEEMLLSVGKAMLESLGYQVTVSTGSRDALKIFKERPLDFDVVVSDQTMPDLLGSDLAKYLLEIRPDLPIVLCTGFNSSLDEQSVKEIGIREYLLKPYNKSELAWAISHALERGVSPGSEFP